MQSKRLLETALVSMDGFPETNDSATTGGFSYGVGVHFSVFVSSQAENTEASSVRPQPWASFMDPVNGPVHQTRVDWVGGNVLLS